ncbi:MAG: hypothetical protein HOQ45_04020, partial [Nocardioidaceae bacterium]|nr:hypothetical protein [Nocardioidaceae bacterium]
MSGIDKDQERLTRGLHDQADRIGADAPIGLADVRREARGIRRRRRFAAAAAAVV